MIRVYDTRTLSSFDFNTPLCIRLKKGIDNNKRRTRIYINPSLSVTINRVISDGDVITLRYINIIPATRMNGVSSNFLINATDKISMPSLGVL